MDWLLAVGLVLLVVSIVLIATGIVFKDDVVPYFEEENDEIPLTKQAPDDKVILGTVNPETGTFTINQEDKGD